MQIPCFTHESSEGGVERRGNSHIRNWHKSVSISTDWTAPQKINRLEADSDAHHVSRTVALYLIRITCISGVPNVCRVVLVIEICINNRLHAGHFF